MTFALFLQVSYFFNFFETILTYLSANFAAQIENKPMQIFKSPKEITLEGKIQDLIASITDRLGSSDDLPQKVANELLANEEIKALHDYANKVSITRLGLNDHGPVHMRTVCKNALKMLSILHDAGIETSLQVDHAGSFEDSLVAVMIAAFLHDIGMSVGRKDHELYSGIIAFQIITDILRKAMPADEDIMRRTIIRSMAMEGILGHMSTHPIHSIEAGLILIADGCDMTKGRARIALEKPTKPTEGDIHKYSANSIEKVHITRGEEHPIKIEVIMKSEVGFFQVEGVLMPKIQSSPAKHLVELYACVEGESMKRYL